MPPRRYMVVMRDLELARRISDQIAFTGYNAVVVGVAAPEEAAAKERAIQPQIILVEQGVANAISSPTRQVTFDPKNFDPVALARAILDGQKAEPAIAVPQPAPASLSWRTAIGLQGISGGVGTTTLTCAFALAAARRGERVMLVDMGGGDSLPTFGLRLSREPKVWQVRENEVQGRLSIVVADTLSQIQMSRTVDVLALDLGAITQRARADEAICYGARVFYVIPQAMDALVTNPVKEQRLVNLCSKPGGDNRFPFDPDLTARINRNEFDPMDTEFMQTCAAWMDGQILN